MALLAAAFLAVLSAGALWVNDEATRITSIGATNSIAYLPYLFAVWLATRVPDTQQLRRIVLIAAILFRFIAFALPPVMSDDHLRYEWEAKTLSQGLNPYRVSPAQLHEPNRSIPGYDFSAVYGPVLEAAHWTVFQLGLPMKTSAALAEGLLLFAAWRRRWPLWRWMLLGWSPLCVYEYWMNGHNDAWLLLLLYLAYEAKGAAAWIWLGLATWTKWWPLLLVPLWFSKQPSLWGALGLGVMMASCLLLMPLAEWITKVRFTTGFLGGWQNNPFLYRFLTDKSQAIAISAVSSIGVCFLRLGQAELVLIFITVLLAFSANIHPWYLGWTLPFLMATKWNPMPWLLAMALLPLAYDPMIGWRLNGTWIEDPLIRVWIWGAVTVFSGYRLISKRNG